MYTTMFALQYAINVTKKEKYRTSSKTDGNMDFFMASITAIVPSVTVFTNLQTMNTRMTAIKNAISAVTGEQMRHINPARNG